MKGRETRVFFMRFEAVAAGILKERLEGWSRFGGWGVCGVRVFLVARVRVVV